ncbi:hypothetical protein KDA_47450 [Dictyobacter alpinus]|uniref:Uncharacterized protein n=1 Tax=Dictyobacter alpinus TaxID=2014873 RepID=A0A402BCZ1_9CHLR|nr:hypothetical protein [Dictyobacter alpinus]GCE29261.1 hypothetical protein KDA_47450 [Dictyobacter alpinus]
MTPFFVKIDLFTNKLSPVNALIATLLERLFPTDNVEVLTHRLSHTLQPTECAHRDIWGMGLRQ